jgi:pimeloyl-ACP methyl ester carboxylesterase
MRVLALLLLTAAPASADSFVLVHGAWAGAWAWDEVAPLLAAEGHEVVALDLLTGGPEVSVEDHVAQVVAAVEAAERPVILVGHSYGTRPVSGAWDRARDQVDHVVFVEGTAPAVDPPPGAPLLRPDTPTLSFLVTTSPDVADSGMLPPPPGPPSRGPLHPMSLRALYGPVPATGEPLPPTPCTYVLAEESSLPILRRYGEALRDRRGCDLREVPGGHDVPTDAPADLAAILLGIAG